MERAVDWLFSHADEMEEVVVQTHDQLEPNHSTSASFKLIAFISHRGTSAHCGHYVAHVLRNDKWILYNDNKVVEVDSIDSVVGLAYMYFYQRIE